MSATVRSNVIAVILLIAGSSQMIGYLVGSRTLRGLGAASMMSPLPKVFCVARTQDEEGLIETFSSQFFLTYSIGDAEHTLPFDPETGHLLRGPYNRRNVYGAALSYAPCLPRDLVDEILYFGLCPGGPLRDELGIPADARDLKLMVRSGSSGADQKQWVFPVPHEIQSTSTP